MDETFYYYRVFTKNMIFRGEGGSVKPIYRGKLPEMGEGLGQFPDLRGNLAKKRWGCFLGALIPSCTLWAASITTNVLTPYGIACVFTIFHHKLMIR